MQSLLVNDVFDSFLLCDGEILTSNTFSINGRINKDFYSSEELASVTEDFATWKNLKHICFEIIKGKKVPTKMKLVFAMPQSSFPKIIEESISPIIPGNIGGLYLHILYENSEVQLQM